jgi:hypothetical protein
MTGHETLRKIREIYPEMELLRTDGSEFDSRGIIKSDIETYVIRINGSICLAPKLLHRPDGKWHVHPEGIDNKIYFLVETLDEALHILRKGKELTK